jgi:hypothetical protein
MKTQKINNNTYIEYRINKHPYPRHGLWNSYLLGDNKFHYKIIRYWYKGQRKGFTLTEKKF